MTLLLSNPWVFCKVQSKNLLLIKRHCCSGVSVLQNNPQSIKTPSNNACLCFLLCNLVSCGRRWERRTCLPLSTKLCNFGCQWNLQNIAEVLQCPFSGFLCKYTSIIASSVAKFHFISSSLTQCALIESRKPYSSDNSSCLWWRFAILEGLCKIYTPNLSYLEILMTHKLLDSVPEIWPNCCSLFYVWSKYARSKGYLWLENALILLISTEVIKPHVLV